MSITNPTGSEPLSLMDAALAIETPGPDEGQAEDEVSAELETEEIQEPEAEFEAEESDEDEAEFEESDEQDEEEQEPQEQAIKVKVDGEEIEVTLDELKSGYSRTKDYTKKTQELAEQRKAFEAESQAILAERQQYQQLLGALEQQLNAENEPDWDTLRATDPIEYSLQMADWQRKQQKKSVVQAEQARVAQLNQIQQQKAFAEQLQKEARALASVIPEWSDEAKSAAVKKAVKEQGKKLGFSDEELAQVYDHRAVLALHKAAKYDELMSKREQLKPAKPTSKVIKPSGKVQEGNSVVKRAKQQFSASGDIRSAVALLNLLEK